MVGGNAKDRPKWNWARNGNYNVNDAKRMLQGRGEHWDDDLWQQVWDNHLVLKIAFFRWTLAHKNLLTWDKL